MFAGQQRRSRGSQAASGTSAPSTVISQHQAAAGSTAGRGGVRQVRWGPDPNVADGGEPSLAAGRTDEGDNDDDDDDDEDEQLVTTSILAINAAKGKVGCSYYDAMTNKLYFIEDQRDSTEWDLCSLIVEQVLPTSVLTSANADYTFLKSLEDKLATLSLPPSATATASSSAAASTTDTETATGKIQIEYRPARDFYSTAGKHALNRVKVLDSDHDDSEPRELEEEIERMLDDRATRQIELGLEALLNNLSANPLTLGCAGALLEHMSTVRARAGDLQGHAIELSSVELLRLDKIMIINSDALTSLQVFRDEAHAATHSRATKEGLSLFGIANLTRTPLGRAKMRDWFLRPSLELNVIEQRHDAVECFLLEDNRHVVDAIRSHIREIKNTPLLLKKLGGGSMHMKDWQVVWKLTFVAIMIRDALVTLSHRHAIEAIDTFCESFDAVAFKHIGSMLNEVIDWAEGELENGRVCVRSGIDESLDEMRRKYSGLDSFLSHVAADMARDVPPELAHELSVVYFPQLGYLATVPHRDGDVDVASFAEIGWTYQFLTENQAYFKNEKCRDMDRHLGDLQCFIADKEIEIIHALLEHVMRIQAQLLAVSHAAAELECLIAFAEAARLYDWTRPVMTSEPVCKILKGRHPLAESCVEHFVPNNTALVAGQSRPCVKTELKEEEDEESAAEDRDSSLDESSMLIITGANFSGKSILLKQIALITYMAHIAFMIDLQQISFALRNCTRRSLLIVDEFGKGTEPDDGAGLFCGVVEYLLKLGSQAPRTVFATHFQHVFLNGVLSRQLPFVLAHMEVFVDDRETKRSVSGTGTEETAGTENLTYLYRFHELRALALGSISLCPGLAVSSNALACAGLFGIPPEVLSRAAFVTECISTFQLDKLLLKAVEEMEPTEMAELQEAERIVREFLAWEEELGSSPEEEVEGGGDGKEGDAEELRKQVRALLEGVKSQ
ncbi:MutS protein msh5 [Rhodotorula mucilaginosa]|uniref:MutS protein msh5 n=1 Tax=Rhodotorula mucilaginosa TaxID=5537 RepID=A0A9P6VXU1_RHOMI|nr:MutS protein msh5 [Rhodotorula mucilaginosa]